MYILSFVFATVLIFYFWGRDLRYRWFAFLMYKLSQAGDAKCEKETKNDEYQELKRDLLKSIYTHVSNDPKLRKDKRIRILEIGVGTGANFAFYPDGTHLVAIDPNPYFKKYYNENRSRFPNIKSEEIIVCGGEDMDMVESGSIDMVMMTLVLCSVKDISAIMKQIQRVLAPGGKFIFVEHIKEFSNSHNIRRAMQRFLTITGLWPLLFDGCQLTRDMLEDIKSAGFSHVEGRRIHATITHWLFQLLSPHLLGIATK